MIYTPNTVLTTEQKDDLADKISKILSHLLSDQYGKDITVTLTRNENEEEKKE